MNLNYEAAKELAVAAKDIMAAEAMLAKTRVAGPAGTPIAVWEENSGWNMDDESNSNRLRVEFSMTAPDENGLSLLGASAAYYKRYHNLMSGQQINSDWTDRGSIRVMASDVTAIMNAMGNFVETYAKRGATSYNDRHWTLPGKKIGFNMAGVTLRYVLQRTLKAALAGG